MKDRILFIAFALVFTVFTFSGIAEAAVSVGIDDTTASDWRTAAALEADNEYGTDGYVVYGLNEADSVYSSPFDTALTNSATLVSLPTYIADITASSAAAMWSGNSNFGQLQDPANGNALTNTSLLAGVADLTFTITRSSDAAFRLTVLVADGDSATVTYATTVEDSAGTATQSYTQTVNGLVYHVYDVSSGTGDVLVTVDADNNNFNATGFAFDGAASAGNPDPANNARGVALDAILTWTTGEDPANPGNPNPAIVEHLVYFGTDPNGTQVATIPVADPAEYGPLTLTRDTTYYWRVDEKLNDDSIITGNTWTFESLLSVPAFDPDLPADVLVAADEDVVLEVDATNPFTGDNSDLTYQWYKDDAPLAGEAGTTLTILAIQVADEGEYFCKAKIGSTNATADSRIATVWTERAVSHWSFDGTLSDSVGGFDGTAIDGDPNFAPGLVDGGQAADFMIGSAITVPTTAHVTSGWSLSWWEWSDPDNNNGGGADKWETILGNGPGPDGWEVFEFGRVQDDRYVFGFNVGGGYIYTPDDDRYPRGQWHQHVVAYDDSTNVAAWYIDGFKVTEFTGVNFDGFDAELYVGNVRALSQTYTGLVDDLILFNYPVTATDVGFLYSDVQGEYCPNPPRFDYDGDCKVALADFADFATEWLDCQLYPDCMDLIPEPVVE